MKKILFQRRNAIFSPSGVSLGAFLFAFVIVTLVFRFFFPGVFVTIAAPLLRAGAALSAFASDIRASFADSATLMRERNALRLENKTLLNQNLVLSAKVVDLITLLGEAPAPAQGIVVGVLARPPEAPYDILLIAAGTTSGVSPGMRAFALGDIPVGEVESVTASSARVRLFSSSGQALSTWVGKNRVPVTLKGGGGGVFKAEEPKDAGIAEGDIVYLASGGALPIGRIGRVETSLSSPKATLFVTPLVNPFEIVWVKLLP